MTKKMKLSLVSFLIVLLASATLYAQGKITTPKEQFGFDYRRRLRASSTTRSTPTT